MEAERYAGERRALSHFLTELRPLVLAELGRDSVLYHRIDRAVRRADLSSLRDARRVFHNQPGALKRRLLHGLLDPAATSADSRASEPAPTAGRFVRFDAAEPQRPGERPSVSLARQPIDGRAVQVFIRPGTLPGAAAGALRAVADRIEAERRLLSPRYWEGAGRGVDGAGSADQA